MSFHPPAVAPGLTNVCVRVEAGEETTTNMTYSTVCIDEDGIVRNLDGEIETNPIILVQLQK